MESWDLSSKRKGSRKAYELRGRVQSCDPGELLSMLHTCIDLVQSEEDVVGGFECIREWSIRGSDTIALDELDRPSQSRLCATFWTFLPAERKTLSAKAREALEAILDLLEHLSARAPRGSPQCDQKTERNRSGKGVRAVPQPVPPLLSMLTSQALQVVDRKVSLIVIEVLSQRYGIQYISALEPNLYQHLVHGSEANQEIGLSRRSKLAIAHLRHEGQKFGLFAEVTSQETAGQRLLWCEIWSETIASTMVASGPDCRRRAHLCCFHIPSLLELAPWCLVPLVKAIKKRTTDQNALAGLLSAMRCAKLKALAVVGEAEHAVRLDDLSTLEDPCQTYIIAISPSLVRTCVSSSIQELQVLGLSLVTDARASSTSLTSDDFGIVRHFLNTNFSQSTPEGRNAVHSILARLMARLKASTHVASRKREGGAGVIEDAKHFLQWLHRLSTLALHPGAPYHIARAGLSYLEMLSFTGVDPSISQANLPKRSAGQLDGLHFPFTATIATPDVVERLLQCADSTFLEVQSSAFRLLSRFPAPLAGLEDRNKAQAAILDKAVRLMLSTRESESNAASLLARLYLEVYIKRCGWSWTPLVRALKGTKEAMEQRPKAGCDMTLYFIDDVLELLDFLLQHDSILDAARHRPIHGTMVALQELFRGINVDACDDEHLRKVLVRTMALIDRAWEVTRGILCNRAPEGSFGAEEHNEMERALEAAEADHDDSDDDNDDDDDGISADEGDEEPDETTPRHQIILSYCWRGMKEASALLGSIVASTVDRRFWTEAQVRSVGERFNMWLSLVRHRGAFSTIYPSYLMAASALVRKDWPEVAKLPADWLESFIDGVASPRSSISTTRRSAGIGFAVLALVCATTSRTERSTIEKTVRRLIGIAHDSDEAASRVHALNILRVLVSDTSLSEPLQPFEGELFTLVIPCFTSTTWRIRNAAMMLFSQLCNRVFTYNLTNRDSAEAKKAWHEFFTRYSGLHDMLREQLTEHLASNGRDAMDAYQSSLFAVLLLLSRLQATDTTFNQQGANPELISPLVEKCLASKIWKLREIAASAYAASTVPKRASRVATEVFSKCTHEDENEAHGRLMAIRRLIVLARQHQLTSDLIDLETVLAQKASMWLEDNACAVTKAAFLDLVEELGGSVVDDASASYSSKWLLESRQLDIVALRDHLRRPGETLLLAACARTMLRLRRDTEADLLSHPVEDVRRQAIKPVSGHPLHLVIQRMLVDMVIEPSEGIITRIEAAKALVPVELSSAATSTEEVSRIHRLEQVALQGASVPLKEAAMPVLAGLLASSAVARNGSRLAAICEAIADRAQEERSFESRISAIETIEKISDLLFPTHSLERGQEEKSFFDARLALLKLVVDDDEDIRGCALAVAGKIGKSSSSDDTEQDHSPTYVARQCPPSCVASVERIWRWMESHYDRVGSALWRDHVWSLLCPSKDQRQMTLSVAFESSTALFAEERPNQFVDPEAQFVAAHAYCLEHAPSSSLIAAEMLQEVSEDAETLLAHIGTAFDEAAATPRSFFTTYQLAMRLSLAMDALSRHLDADVSGQRSTKTAKQQQALDRLWKLKGESPAEEGPSDPGQRDQEQVDREVDALGLANGQTKLHIAMVSDFFFPNVGGVEGHIYMLSHRLLERGHKVIVITHAYPPHRVGVRYLSGGLKVYYVPYQVIARQDTLPNFFSLLPLLRQILVREGIDLVHAHQALSSMGLESLLHAKSMGLKTVFTDHSLFGFSDAASILTNKLLRFLLSDVDAVVCVSHTAKENTTLRANLDPCKVSVVPNAVESDSFKPRTPTLVHEDPRQVTIVVLSRLMYRKGIDLLLACIPRLCALDPHIRFIIGGDGPKRVELEQMRERFSSLHSRVDVCGAIRAGSQVRNHLVKGHVFLNTSLTEAFGTGIVEAASCGLLVVSTRVGGIPEVLPDWMNLLAEPDEDDIVDTTLRAIRLVRLRLLKSRMMTREERESAASTQGASGSEGEPREVAPDPWNQHTRLSQMYSWSNTAQRVERVYMQALKKPMPSTLERLVQFRQGGPIAGIIFVIVVSVEMLFLIVLKHLSPSDDIEVLDPTSGEPDEVAKGQGQPIQLSRFS
ncbi:hypothetical protein FA10DRAFT_301922 [Acaromyces ingoldii]|uniref:Phosphatidylinositol N-acetylglucosaminyltransferase n=1 Tax=Acaromyces ingoldii TaxID=215250 RepID=A0A316YRT1_9BASI|nr:hypothetical protein FA10DRAFT_301922 [Acaromyces ingoldii]PWN90713.1 hypothetical protein FA10DRAFT_301922 [Acaromyces ingoldii]